MPPGLLTDILDIFAIALVYGLPPDVTAGAALFRAEGDLQKQGLSGGA